MGNNPVGKKVNTPKVNTRVNTFLRKYLGIYTFIRKYPGCLKVNTFLLLALGFYLNPNTEKGILTSYHYEGSHLKIVSLVAPVMFLCLLLVRQDWYYFQH